MIGPETQRPAFGDHRLRGQATDAEVRLDERALDHADGSRRDVMVVPARVVAGRPADEPDVYVLVAVDRGVVPPAPGVGDLIAPRFGAVSQVLDQLSQLALVEIPRR